MGKKIKLAETFFEETPINISKLKVYVATELLIEKNFGQVMQATCHQRYSSETHTPQALLSRKLLSYPQEEDYVHTSSCCRL